MFNFFSRKSTGGEQLENDNALTKVDLCFVVDNTGSMGTFIEAAKAQLIDVIQRLSADSKIGLQIGLVRYRDHKPQDSMFVTKVHDLERGLNKVRSALNSMKPEGGGDSAEAVYQGVIDAVDKISWRAHSCRFVILVGDAPPHGFVQFYNRFYSGESKMFESDAWPNGCPSELDVHRVGASMERKGVAFL